MADVKVLVIGDNSFSGGIQKGDVWEVVPSVSDWGNATVAPKWVRLTITNVPGTQENAENTVRQYLTSWREGFTYSEVAGATGGQQRYRVEVTPEIGAALPQSIEIAIRDAILARFDGTLANQQASSHFEFDTYPGLPLDEIAFEVSQVTGGLRRYRFSDALVDNALAGVPDGQPAEETATAQFVNNNIIDKLAAG